jgi:hypothetical protein
MHFFQIIFYPLQHAAFAACCIMMQMVQLGEMQHLCSVEGVTPLGVPHVLQMLHRADAVLRCTFCCGAMTTVEHLIYTMMRRAACCNAMPSCIDITQPFKFHVTGSAG